MSSMDSRYELEEAIDDYADAKGEFVFDSTQQRKKHMEAMWERLLILLDEHEEAISKESYDDGFAHGEWLGGTQD